jgi:Sulfotransferase domain
VRGVLVTGIPRAGTSWVGRMLDASGRFIYINEPMSPHHPPGGSPGVLRAPVAHRFQYISEVNEDAFLEPFRDTLALRYSYRAELAVNRSTGDLLRLVQRSGAFRYGRLRGRSALIDDPFAVLSSEWFARRLACRVLIVVRHPAAWISSRLKLGWRTDFGALLAQPLLLEDWLGGYRDEMEELRGTDDAIAEGALLWRMVHDVVDRVRARNPEIEVVRHEDLSLEPVAGFRALYESLGLEYTPEIERIVRAGTSGGGRERRMAWTLTKGGLARTAFRPLDSRANATKYRSALTAEQIDRIWALTGDVAERFYG